MADDAIFDASVKKKKKKVKKIVDLDATPDVEEPIKNEEVVEESSIKESQETQEKENDNDDMNLDDFSAMKKKRKKKPKKKVEDETGKTEGENDENANKEKQVQELEDGINNIKLTENENVSEGTDYEDREYTYDELLTRVFDVMRAKNPDAVAGEKKKFVMRPPQVVKVGTKKTSFVNFSDISKLLHRQPKHLLAFILAELGTSGSIDGTNQLVIKGRFQQKQIESVLRRYIKEYVTCHTCRSPETLLQKETRLYFLQCEVCGSRCSVASIKSGFQAITGRRALLKNKQT